MAQRQRRPETHEATQTAQTAIEQLRQQVQSLQRLQLTPEQLEAVRRILQDLQRIVPPTPAPAGGTRPGATMGQAPAPRRVQQFVYDINVSGTTYRLTLSDRLPTDQQGNVDVAAAKRRLHEALLHNEPAPLGGHMSASVKMMGNGPEVSRFNAGPENQRMDIFHDRYLGQSYRDGQYVENSGITIAQVQAQKPRGG